MGNNLLIVGAGIYALVAKEIAESMGGFDKIDFIDDYEEESKLFSSKKEFEQSDTEKNCTVSSISA